MGRGAQRGACGIVDVEHSRRACACKRRLNRRRATEGEVGPRLARRLVGAAPSRTLRCCLEAARAGGGRWARMDVCTRASISTRVDNREPGVPPAGSSGVDRCLVMSLIRRAGVRACVRATRPHAYGSERASIRMNKRDAREDCGELGCGSGCAIRRIRGALSFIL